MSFHGLALITLKRLATEHSAGNGTLVAALVDVRGKQIPQAKEYVQDNSLQAWPWMVGTFSWVEPTSWCLLALKHWRRTLPIAAERVDTAERLLMDRQCKGGGWNYGNSNMMGQDLRPYVPTTAIALLALQDRQEQVAVRTSLGYLEKAAPGEQSSSAQALAIAALRTYGRNLAPLRESLQRSVGITIELGNHLAAAHALYALSDENALAY